MNIHLQKFYDAIKSLDDKDFIDKGVIHLIKLLKTSFITDLINDSLIALSTQENYYPVNSSTRSWNILNTNTFSLTFIKIEKDLNSRFMNSYPFDKIITPLTGDIFYSHYKQLAPFPDNILDKNKKLTPIKINKILSKGTPYKIRKLEDVFSYKGASDDTILLSFSSKTNTSFSWEYNSNTLLPLRLIASVQQSARLEHTCKLLGELGASTSLPILFEFLKNKQHNVRWEAARAIMNIDFDKGIEALNFLQNDDHPDISESVQNALNKISILNPS